MRQHEIAAVFDEWARRYAEDPESFDDAIVDESGQPITAYGEQCAAYFLRIASDLSEGRQGEKKARKTG